MTSTNEKAAEIVKRYTSAGEKIGTAESLTAGLISATIADIPGASNVLHGGHVVYCDEAKKQFLGVPSDILEQYTAVSSQCAEAMVLGLLKSMPDIAVGVAVTGYAGPSGVSPDKDGLVYISVARRKAGSSPNIKIIEKHFPGERNDVRQQVVETALNCLLKFSPAQS